MPWGFYLGAFILKIMQKQRNFLENVQKHVTKIEIQKKNEEIGMIINSLQKPMTDVLQSLVLKQIEDVEELIKTLQWQRKKHMQVIE